MGGVHISGIKTDQPCEAAVYVFLRQPPPIPPALPGQFEPHRSDSFLYTAAASTGESVTLNSTQFDQAGDVLTLKGLKAGQMTIAVEVLDTATGVVGAQVGWPVTITCPIVEGGGEGSASTGSGSGSESESPSSSVSISGMGITGPVVPTVPISGEGSGVPSSSGNGGFQEGPNSASGMFTAGASNEGNNVPKTQANAAISQVASFAVWSGVTGSTLMMIGLLI